MSYKNSEIGKKIKKLREDSHLTQQQLAEYLNVDQSLVSKFEKSERTISSDILTEISILFCCSLHDLLSNEDIMPKFNIAFRQSEISLEDLKELSIIHKIALNQVKIDELSKGVKNHD